MGDQKRGTLYQAGRIAITAANDIESFNLPNNAEGFHLRAIGAGATVVVKFAVVEPSQGGVIDGITGLRPWTDAEFASDTGRYETLLNSEGGWRNLRFESAREVKVTSGTAGTVVEVIIFQ